MKKMLLASLVVALAVAWGMPQESRANGYYYYNNWWVPGAAFFGGTLFGMAISRPYPPPAPVYAYPPPVVYSYPQPVYAYPPQSQGYVYQAPAPPPAPVPQAQAPVTGQGEWVTVPGQWVGDKYVPPHSAWVPR